jgi:hypothetical protein
MVAILKHPKPRLSADRPDDVRSRPRDMGTDPPQLDLDYQIALRGYQIALRGLLLPLESPHSHDARPVDPAHVELAGYLLSVVQSPATPVAEVIATDSGGVRLEWRADGVHFEISTVDPFTLAAHFYDETTGEKWHDNIAEWTRIIATITDLERRARMSRSQVATPNEPNLARVREMLREFSAMPVGWDGGSAKPPSATAIRCADEFLVAAAAVNFNPRNVAPSVVGGIGVTFRANGRKSYVEFYNDGRAAVLHSDGVSEPEVHSVRMEGDGSARLVEEIRRYLNA